MVTVCDKSARAKGLEVSCFASLLAQCDLPCAAYFLFSMNEIVVFEIVAKFVFVTPRHMHAAEFARP